MIINTNFQAIIATTSLWHKNNDLAKSSEKLSIGTKINKSGDDPSGNAISYKMKRQIRGLEMADRNTNDAVSLIQTAEGGVSEMHNITQRLRELAVQGSNDTLTKEDREIIQIEINSLIEEIDSLSSRVEFNKKPLLNENYDNFIFQVGGNEGQEINLSIPVVNSTSLGLNNLDYTTVKGCQDALEKCDKAVEMLSSQRAELGAMQGRLEQNSSSISIYTENMHQSLSRIVDTDMALEMSNYTKNNVLVQSGIAMLAQANQRPNQILSLLQ